MAKYLITNRPQSNSEMEKAKGSTPYEAAEGYGDFF